MENNFKVGDKVRRRKANQNFMWEDGDKVFAISKITPSGIQINQSSKPLYEWDTNLFDLIEQESLEDQIQKAKDLIGKTVRFKNIVGENKNSTIDFVSVALSKNYQNSSIVNEAFDVGKEFVIVLWAGNSQIPLSSVIETKTEETVKLNNSYSAVVTKKTIKVGCQEFPVEILKELQIALESLDD